MNKNKSQEIDDSYLKSLKEAAASTRLAAERAAYAYFCECPVGPERERAHEVYSNILYATRIG